MKIKAYKGFNADMTCRDFQFEEGKTYKEDKAKLCDIGTWVVAPEYGDYDGKGYPIIGIVSAKIDGKVLKPDTWYTVQDGKFVAAE